MAKNCACQKYELCFLAVTARHIWAWHSFYTHFYTRPHSKAFMHFSIPLLLLLLLLLLYCGNCCCWCCCNCCCCCCCCLFSSLVLPAVTAAAAAGNNVCEFVYCNCLRAWRRSYGFVLGHCVGLHIRLHTYTQTHTYAYQNLLSLSSLPLSDFGCEPSKRLARKTLGSEAALAYLDIICSSFTSQLPPPPNTVTAVTYAICVFNLE